MKTSIRCVCVAIVVSLFCAGGFAGEKGKSDPVKAGDAFIPALARHFDVNPQELANLSRRGYGRNELIKLILISKKAHTELKEIVIQRDEGAKLSTLCERHAVNYDEILAESVSHRKAIDDELSRPHP